MFEKSFLGRVLANLSTGNRYHIYVDYPAPGSHSLSSDDTWMGRAEDWKINIIKDKDKDIKDNYKDKYRGDK